MNKEKFIYNFSDFSNFMCVRGDYNQFISIYRKNMNIPILVDTKTGKFSRKFLGSHKNDVINNGFFFKNYNKFLTVSRRGEARIWDITSGECLSTFTHWEDTEALDEILSCAIHPDQNIVALGGDYGVVIFNINSGKVIDEYLHDYGNLASYVRKVLFTPNGRYILSASEDWTMRLWDIDKKKVVRIFKNDKSEVGWLSCAIHPNGKEIFSVCDPENVVLWDLESGKEIRYYHGHADSVAILSCNLSSDGKWAISGSFDGELLI